MEAVRQITAEQLANCRLIVLGQDIDAHVRCYRRVQLVHC